MKLKSGALVVAMVGLALKPVYSAPAGASTQNFADAGLKVAVESVSTSNDKKRLTITVVITNTSEKDLRASIIGAVGGVDDMGTSMEADKIYGFSYCNAGAFTIRDCVDHPQTRDYPDYTEIDKGSSATIPIAFAVNGGSLSGNSISFSMRIAVAPPVAEKADTTPPRPKIISLGLPLIPLAHKAG